MTLATAGSAHTCSPLHTSRVSKYRQVYWYSSVLISWLQLRFSSLTPNSRVYDTAVVTCRRIDKASVLPPSRCPRRY
ncbi:hypothetical protein BDZ97DRAFT_1024606 [Flammula alnicola]|nr:hypothetical protein BDZ97DRAFT_1024606 [Flammula alnicola]